MNFIKSLLGLDGNQDTQSYELDGQTYQELTLLAEGGYAYVWRALHVQTKKIVILKKQLCPNEEALQRAETEIRLHRQLGKHENIVQYLGGKTLLSQGRQQAVIAMEMCEGGTLYDLLLRHKERQLNEEQIMFIMRHLVSGIAHMHSQAVPITHRDIKVENILLHEKIFKLCDFGSASTDIVDFATTSKLEAAKHEETFEKNTTLMYRPPEMSDLYMKYEVNTKVDIWMLGCVLYTMCFYIHPFQDASKLAIVQADYKIPKQHKYSPKLIDLLSKLLIPNPKLRPSIYDVSDLINLRTVERPIKQSPAVQQSQPVQQQSINITVKQSIDDFDDFQEAPQQPQQQPQPPQNQDKIQQQQQDLLDL